MRAWPRTPLPGWRSASATVYFDPCAIDRIVDSPLDPEVCEVRLKSGDIYDLAMPASDVAALVAAAFKQP